MTPDELQALIEEAIFDYVTGDPAAALAKLGLQSLMSFFQARLMSPCFADWISLLGVSADDDRIVSIIPISTIRRKYAI